MTPRKSSSPPDADSLYEATVKALARSARSSGELRQYLLKRHATKTQMEAILKRLRENGYLDDARFARAFASSRLQNDLHGPARVGRDLAARRVHPEIARAALDAAYEGIDEGELLRQYLRRKAGRSRLPDKPSAVNTLYRRLLRAGFRSATIVRELRRMLPEPPVGKFRAVSEVERLSKGPRAEAVSWEELLESLAETDESEPRLP